MGIPLRDGAAENLYSRQKTGGAGNANPFAGGQVRGVENPYGAVPATRAAGGDNGGGLLNGVTSAYSADGTQGRPIDGGVWTPRGQAGTGMQVFA